MLMAKITDLREVRAREVIEVERLIGAGVENDPARIIQEYYDFDGNFLARRDDMKASSVASTEEA